ncbi:hypothetical protein GOB93_14725 [Acetobacter musti]|uniref:Uncharacterized protein n=1 Tax=Acetobacter musti TaxID=864732 RepID=A0ABX0JSV4_9PROT|nr:hypothetical protein [Acetobacter musti]NHN85887.1 hypothetical protein [Acetobacter musti]
MQIRRLFLSGEMNLAGSETGPSGVSGAITVPAAPDHGLASVVFPECAAGAGLLVSNDGSRLLTLWYVPGQSAPPSVPDGARANGGNITIAPGARVMLTDCTGTTGVTYQGDAFTVVPGTLHYAGFEDPADHPAATVCL